MRALSSPRFLCYSGVPTLVFAVTVLCGDFATLIKLPKACGFAVMRNPNFGMITTRRINIVKPDGTVRLHRFPDTYFSLSMDRHVLATRTL